MGEIEWVGTRVVSGGMVEREFRVPRTGGSAVPGVLWSPERDRSDEPKPLVLLGHGGSGDKRTGHHVELARWFVTQAGFAAMAIDGPYNGDRVPAPLEPADYQARIAREGVEVVLDRMAEDWMASLAAVVASGLADDGRVAYAGMSLGARFGLPFVARLGDRVRCVVLGKFGLEQGPNLHAGLAAPERFAADARRVSAPLLAHVQWDDENFPRAGQLALFDAYGSTEKRLIAFPGRHGGTDPAAIALWQAYVREHLAGSGDRPS